MLHILHIYFSSPAPFLWRQFQMSQTLYDPEAQKLDTFKRKLKSFCSTTYLFPSCLCMTSNSTQTPFCFCAPKAVACMSSKIFQESIPTSYSPPLLPIDFHHLLALALNNCLMIFPITMISLSLQQSPKAIL